MKWNRRKIEDLINSDGSLTITRTSPGGDWDLEGMRITAPGAAPNEHVMIVPFLEPSGPDTSTIDHNDCEVYALEVQSWNCDSRGGCQTTDIPTASTYGTITAKLRSAGFNIIGHYDEIF